MNVIRQVWEVYEEWSTAGEPVEVTLADGKKRKTWPMDWDTLAATLSKARLFETGAGEPSFSAAAAL